VPVTVNDLPISDNPEAVSVQGLTATAKIPVGAIVGKQAASLGVSAVAELTRAGATKGPVESVAKLDVDVAVPMGPPAAPNAPNPPNASPAAGAAGISGTVKLMDVNTAVADHILGKPGFLAGSVGEKVQMQARVVQQPGAAAGGPRAQIEASFDAARLRGA